MTPVVRAVAQRLEIQLPAAHLDEDLGFFPAHQPVADAVLQRARSIGDTTRSAEPRDRPLVLATPSGKIGELLDQFALLKSPVCGSVRRDAPQ
jgi:hypothetical protein